jgi:hypothetical protein
MSALLPLYITAEEAYLLYHPFNLITRVQLPTYWIFVSLLINVRIAIIWLVA